jgi:hypothetical protein
MSIILGRPRLINANDCNIKIEIYSEIPPELSESSKRPYSFFKNFFGYQLSLKIHDIRNSGADKPGVEDYSLVQKLHVQILQLLDNLPMPFRQDNEDLTASAHIPHLLEQREQILTSIYSLILGLHRPHISIHPESQKAVLEAGLVVLDSQQRYFEATNRYRYNHFGPVFYSIDATIMISATLSIMRDIDKDLISKVRRAIQDAIGRLSLMEDGNNTAKPGVQILRLCYRKVQEICEEPRSSVNQPGSMFTDNIRGSEPSTNSFTPSADSIQTPSSQEPLSFDRPSLRTVDAHINGNVALSPVLAEANIEFDNSFWMNYMQQMENESSMAMTSSVPWESSL